MSNKINPKFISEDMTTDVELATETTARQSADSALQNQINSHATRHLPNGADPILTGTPVATGTANNAGTANSFSKSDHIHNTVIFYSSTRSNVETSTTSTTNVSLISTTPVAGTYMVLVNTMSFNNTNNTNGTFGLYVNGVLVANTEVTVARGSQTAPLPYSITVPVTVNGSESIEIQWRTSSGTLTNSLRSIVLIRLG